MVPHELAKALLSDHVHISCVIHTQNLPLPLHLTQVSRSGSVLRRRGGEEEVAQAHRKVPHAATAHLAHLDHKWDQIALGLTLTANKHVFAQELPSNQLILLELVSQG